MTCVVFSCSKDKLIATRVTRCDHNVACTRQKLCTVWLSRLRCTHSMHVFGCNRCQGVDAEIAPIAVLTALVKWCIALLMCASAQWLLAPGPAQQLQARQAGHTWPLPEVLAMPRRLRGLMDPFCNHIPTSDDGYTRHLRQELRSAVAAAGRVQRRTSSCALTWRP